MVRSLYVDQIFSLIGTAMNLGNNRAATVDATGFSRPTVDKYCNLAGLPRNLDGLRSDGRFGRAFTQAQEEKILTLYEKTQNASEAARVLGFSAGAITRCWKGHNLRAYGLTLNQDDQADVVGAYLTCRGNLANAMRQLFRAEYTIKKIWHRYGLSPTGHSRTNGANLEKTRQKVLVLERLVRLKAI